MKKYTKVALGVLILFIVAIYPSLTMKVYAAESEEIYIETKYSQSDAREMLSMINEFRTDSTGGAWYWNEDDTTKTIFNTDGNTVLGELKYDYELEKTAMQRAAEIAVSFSHTRPSGTRCFTAFPASGYYYMGENIAAGYSSASSVFVGWQENDDPYAGQGHRRNMLNPNFNAIGIGHVYVNGVHYWTQALGYTSNTTTPTAALNSTVTSAIAVDGSLLSLENTVVSGESSYSLNVGEKVTAPELIYQYNFDGHWPSYTYITTVPTAADWKSKDSSVAYVENGKIIAAGAGSTVLTSSKTSQQITVEVKSSLKITTQPQTAYAKNGATIKLNVAASGEGLTYQWYYKRPGESTFVKSSITTATYSLTMKALYSGRQLYCVVTDKYGASVKSDTAYIYLAATITKQPTNVSVAAGTKFTTQVTAIGDGLTYQWYYKKVGSSTYSKSAHTTAAYSITMKSEYSGRQLYCVVTDKYGNTAKSDVITISVPAVKITTQPQTTYTKVGSAIKMKVAASGEGLTYQWYYKKPGESAFIKSTITTATYSLTMKELYSGRQLYCVVTDKNGNSVKSNTAYIYVAATITKQPTNVSVAAGTKFTTKVTAVGDGLTYQWYYKKVGSSTYSKSAHTTAAYSITMKSEYSGRQLYCVVTDKYGNTAKSNVITISVPAVKITTQPQTTYAKVGSVIKMKVAASGDGLKYQWYYKRPGESTFVKSTITTATYSVTMKELYSGRQMYCVVTDKYGNSVKSNSAYLYMAATITKQPTNVSAAAETKFTTKVSAVGDGLTYQWYYKNPGASAYTKSIHKSAAYSVTMKSEYNGRQLYCVVTDKYGNTAKSDVITLTVAKG